MNWRKIKWHEYGDVILLVIWALLFILGFIMIGYIAAHTKMEI